MCVRCFFNALLDHCNPLLSRLRRSTIQPLQHVMNEAARIIMNLSVCNHVKPALKGLLGYQSSRESHISSICSCTCLHIGQTPQCLSDCVCTVSATCSRYRLRSNDTADYFLPRTRTKFGECGFCYSGPAAWNSLPPDLHDVTDTNLFKKWLKILIELFWEHFYFSGCIGIYYAHYLH